MTFVCSCIHTTSIIPEHDEGRSFSINGRGAECFLKWFHNTCGSPIFLASLNGAGLHFHLLQWHLVYGTFEPNKPARCSHPCQRPDMRLLLLSFVQAAEVLLTLCSLVVPIICKTTKIYDER